MNIEKLMNEISELRAENFALKLNLPVVSNSFICVKDQEPPKNTELIAQDPKGVNHLTSWRESYKIFMCQNKQDNSYEWKWKQI